MTGEVVAWTGVGTAVGETLANAGTLTALVGVAVLLAASAALLRWASDEIRDGALVVGVARGVLTIVVACPVLYLLARSLS